MFIIIWKYQVKVENRKEFEKNYSTNGLWAELFKKSSGYLGTELLYDETNLQNYLTIDRWESKESYEAFMAQWQEEYKFLDVKCERLTEGESFLGKWNLK
jgi:heme-degrading monooxygenase HmoA